MTSVASQKSVNWRAEPEVQETGRNPCVKQRGGGQKIRKKMINDKRLVFFPKQGTVRGSHGFSMLSSGVICFSFNVRQDDQRT